MLSENARVDATVDALRAGDLEAVGRLLDASHASLRDDYEASVPEVEATVERLKAAGAAGARMMGGGFGGAVLALFPPGAALPDGATVVAPGPPARRALTAQPSGSSPSGRHSAHAMKQALMMQHADPRVQVDVDVRGLLDRRVGLAEPEDREDHPVDQEQAADQPADVEQPRRLGGALRVGLLALLDERVAGRGGVGDSAMSISLLPEDDAQDEDDAEHADGQRGRLAVPGLLLLGERLGFVGHAVDEALQLLDRLGLREQRDDRRETTASATKAAIAPQNAAACADPRLMMSQLLP